MHKDGVMGSYLGLPEKIHGSKIQVFFLRDRLQKRINILSVKFLSKGGKEVLIKSIAQVFPTYVMSCFFSLKKFALSLAVLLQNFGGKQGKKVMVVTG